jgi:acyl-CoA synthetase (NDP forming)/GNAT superfamily N-acetyltransferase
VVSQADVLLADGSTVQVRPIDPSDAEGILAMHAKFSERTRYFRYFSPYPRIPERDLHRFVNVDHRDREALVVVHGGDLIAVGRYERLGPDADEAEVAFVVADAFQGMGIGSMLLEHLAAAARDADISQFVAEVLPANGSMLRVFADAGYQIQREYADGVVHLAFPIEPTEASRAVQWRREQSTEARSIARLLAPRGVALYGARRDGKGIGAALLRHLATFNGPVHPVYPGTSLVDLPGPVDLAVIAVPAAKVPDAVADAALAGVAGVVVVSSGFAETGSAGAAAQRELRRAVRTAGLRLVGPNCLGIANTDPAVRLNATLAPQLPPRGRAGFFSQSGSLGVALLATAYRRGLGLSTFVSAGNRADVSGNDLLQFWQDDPATDVVLLYLETFGNPRKFARLARRLGRQKPIVAVAHAPTEVPFGGVIRVGTVTELFDVGVLLAEQPLPAGTRVGIVTNSSALGVLAAAACEPAGLTVTVRADVGPTAEPERFAEALSATAEDPEVDALVVACAPPLPAEPGPTAEPGPAAEPVHAGAPPPGSLPPGSLPPGSSPPGSSPPGSLPPGAVPAPVGRNFADVLADFSAEAGGRLGKPLAVTLLADEPPAGVPAYPSVEEAVRALGRVAAYARWRREPAGTVPALSTVDSPNPLEEYGIQVVPSRTVTDPDAAVAAAEELGYPVAVKIAQPELRHRLDLGAVRLDLLDAATVRRACAELVRAFGAGAPAELIVQRMVPSGVSCVVEAVEDPSFGPIVGFGPGGVTGDLLGDRAWRAAPLTDRDADRLIREPRSAPLLFGYRNAVPVDVDALRDLLLRVGLLVDAHPEVLRLTLNPVLARPDGVSVLHAAIQYGEPLARPDTGPRRLL